MGIKMSSVNISITEDVYRKLKKLKGGDKSFSEVITLLVERKKDISRCFGLLEGEEGLDEIREEAARSRKAKWRR
jgi:predicted CopG family antitoxin